MAQVLIPLRRLDRRAPGIALVAAVASLVALGIETYVFTIAYPYPGFARIGEREFPDRHAFHANRITYSIGPAPARGERWLDIAAALAGDVALVARRSSP